MIRDTEKIQSGIFDSSILRKGITKSQEREVLCYELELFHESSGTSFVDGRCYPIRRGMLLTVRPGQIRHSFFPVKCSFVRLFVGADSDFEATVAKFPECIYIEDEKTVEELLSLFLRLSTHVSSSLASDWRTMRINADFTAILYKCMRQFNSPTESEASDSHGRLAHEAYEYISENFKRQITLAELSEALHVSKSYLHAVFKNSIGMTPQRLITIKRIDSAKRMISAGEKTMLEIALEIGFCSQSHFNKVFLRECGMTPAAYKKTLGSSY